MKKISLFIALLSLITFSPKALAMDLVSDSSTSWSSGLWRNYNFRSYGGFAKLELSTVNCNPLPMASMRVRIVHSRSGHVSYEGQTTYQGFQPACHHMHKLVQDVRLERGEYRLEVTADNSCGDSRRCTYNMKLTDSGFAPGPGPGPGPGPIDLVSDSSSSWSAGLWRNYNFRTFGGFAKLEMSTVNCNPLPMASMRVRIVHARFGHVAYEGQTNYQGFQPACHHNHKLQQDVWLERGEYRLEVTADNSCNDHRRCVYRMNLGSHR